MTSIERHRGRIERWTVRASTELNAYVARFPSVGQVIQITREVTDRGGSHTDVDYFITSCSPLAADPLRLLRLIRCAFSG